jgi:hypothetical protein
VLPSFAPCLRRLYRDRWFAATHEAQNFTGNSSPSAKHQSGNPDQHTKKKLGVKTNDT